MRFVFVTLVTLFLVSMAGLYTVTVARPASGHG